MHPTAWKNEKRAEQQGKDESPSSSEKKPKRTAKMAKLGDAQKVAGYAFHTFPTVSAPLCRATRICWPWGGCEMR